MARVDLHLRQVILRVVERIDRPDGRVLQLGRIDRPVPVADTSSSGRGAARAAISMLFVSMRRLGPFSQMHPPCMCADTMFTGAAARTRSSTAVSMKVCVPPPEAPVQAMRLLSTSGSDWRKSTERMPFQSCSPMRLSPQSCFRSSPKVRWSSCVLSL